MNPVADLIRQIGCPLLSGVIHDDVKVAATKETEVFPGFSLESVHGISRNRKAFNSNAINYRGYALLQLRRSDRDIVASFCQLLGYLTDDFLRPTNAGRIKFRGMQDLHNRPRDSLTRPEKNNETAGP